MIKIKKIIYSFLILGVTLNAQNSLINEDSPYLLQHANNPISWNTWSDEAFSKAKKEDKLIFLSIGYSTCHWCHVMERESFEDEDFAHEINKHFISIKVDREELPHVDKYYQHVYQLMNSRGGGWPLNIILTPDLKPIYSLTYAPKGNLLMMLDKLSTMYKKDKSKVTTMANKLHEGIEKSTLKNRISSNFNKSAKEMSELYVNSINEIYDIELGGLLSEPKFPQASSIITLLEIHKLTGNEKALELSIHWLESLAKGGIYDQIEGGFYRYSVDKYWKIPHFEKMLYTNAELLECYTLAYAITQNFTFKKIADEIVDYLKIRTLDETEELLYSASDADSEDEEGKYFVFDYAESSEALKSIDNKDEILKYLNITEDGNFEDDKSNPLLNEFKSISNFGKAKEILKKLRSKVEYPFIDNKIQTSWNAMMISSLLKGGYKNFGLELLDKLVLRMYKKGELYHQVLPSKELKIKAYFEDYSFLVESLLEAYEVTLEEKYLSLADQFSQSIFDKFYKNGVMFLSEDGFRVRSDVDDNAYKSALSSFISSILRLSVLKTNINYQYKAKEIINNNSLYLSKYPAYYPSFTLAYLQYKSNVIVLKSKKDNLENVNMSFVYKQESKDSKFLACSYDRCFATEEKLENLTNKIKKFRDESIK